MKSRDENDMLILESQILVLTILNANLPAVHLN